MDYFENRFYVAAAKETYVAPDLEPEMENPVAKDVQKVSSDERKLIDEILREYLG